MPLMRPNAPIIKAEEFWDHPYLQQLPSEGRLALYYHMCRSVNHELLILEDMALATGIEVSACEDWVEYFERSGITYE